MRPTRLAILAALALPAVAPRPVHSAAVSQKRSIDTRYAF